MATRKGDTAQAATVQAATTQAESAQAEPGRRAAQTVAASGALEAAGVVVARFGRVLLVELDRPARRNAVDGPTAAALAQAFRDFDADPGLDVAVLHGRGGHFCAGADLHAVAGGEAANRVEADGDGPMGPTRMRLTKPVIAAIEGFAVAGGLELALWADLRVVARSGQLGVFCRRFGVPLIDGGTVRLPALIGLSRALELILTGRAVDAEEALRIGLCHRLVEDGEACAEALRWGQALSQLPMATLRSDRLAAIEGVGLPFDAAMENEFCHGVASLHVEASTGAARFVAGEGRHGLARESVRAHDTAEAP